jgi:hypothetical protein
VLVMGCVCEHIKGGPKEVEKKGIRLPRSGGFVSILRVVGERETRGVQ